jgi:hypothetical protein
MTPVAYLALDHWISPRLYGSQLVSPHRVHSNVPDKRTSYERGGWQTRYFEPMARYFAETDNAVCSRPISLNRQLRADPSTRTADCG